MSKIRFVDPGIIVTSGGENGGDSSISSSYALSASHADFATSASYAEYAVSASYEIIKEESSSFADTASYVNPLQQSVLITGSLDLSGSVDIAIPSGSAFTITETDKDQKGRLDFTFDDGDPTLEIEGRSSVAKIVLSANDGESNNLKIQSDGQVYASGVGPYTGSIKFLPDGIEAISTGTNSSPFIGSQTRPFYKYYMAQVGGQFLSLGTYSKQQFLLNSSATGTQRSDGLYNQSSGMRLIVSGSFVSGDTGYLRNPNNQYFQIQDDSTGTGNDASIPFRVGKSGSLAINLSQSKGFGFTQYYTASAMVHVEAEPNFNLNLFQGNDVSGNNVFEVDRDGNISASGNLEVTNITASVNVSSSATSTASFGTYLGDGSQLSGISSTPFPFTGDAQITGSLIISGSFIPTGKTPLSVYNVIIGREAGEIANAQTSYNVFVGGRAGGQDNDFGDKNVLVGYEAGYLGNQTGNTSIGYHAGRGWGTTGATPTTGYNTSIGYQSGYGAATRTTETHNTLLGAFTGRNLTAGSGNTLLGYYAGYNNLGDGNIIIGSGSMGIASMTNQLRIGNGSFHIISGSLTTGDITLQGNVSSSATSTASFGTYLGDGSQLSGIETDPFPYTGDAVISGSLTVQSGSSNSITGITLINPSNPGTTQDTGAGITMFNYTGATGSIHIKDYTSGGTNPYHPAMIFNSSDAFYFKAADDARDGTWFTAQKVYQNFHMDQINNNAAEWIMGINNGGSSYSRLVIGQGSTTANGWFFQNNGYDEDLKIGETTGAGGTGTYTNRILISSSRMQIGDSSNDLKLSVSGSITSNNTASAAYFVGDGSQLTNLPSTTPFPFTGSAIISGSLEVQGDFNPHPANLSSNNIGIGLVNNNLTGGSFNVFMGYEAGKYGSLPQNNVAIGRSAGFALGTGQNNVFIGYRAGYANGTTGASYTPNNNTAVGAFALDNMLSGDYNVALGYRAGDAVTGAGNLMIGYEAGASLSSGDGNIFIGSGSLGADTPSNQLRIGNGNSLVTISASLATGDIIFASTASAAYFVGDGSQLTNLPSTSPFPFTGSAIISGSSEVTGSFSVTSDAGHMFQINNDGTFTLGDGAAVASSNATAIGTNANANANATAYGNYANASGGGANSFGSFSSATGNYSVAVGYDADATANHSIALGSYTNNTAANSILMQTVGASNITNSDPRVFKVHMSNYTVADFQLGSFNTDSILRSNVEINNPSASAATSSLAVHGSGSTVFDVIGSQGTLFSVDDDLSGTIFTANDISGLPILEASASGDVYIGKSPQSLYTTAVISSTTAATTQSIFGLSTSSYDGAFFDYTVQSGSDARAGSIMAVWNGGNISFTETTTTDIGNTTDFNLIVHISQSQAQIASHATNAGYKIKTIIRSI